MRATKKYAPRPAWECNFYLLQHLQRPSTVLKSHPRCRGVVKPAKRIPTLSENTKNLCSALSVGVRFLRFATPLQRECDFSSKHVRFGRRPADGVLFCIMFDYFIASFFIYHVIGLPWSLQEARERVPCESLATSRHSCWLTLN